MLLIGCLYFYLKLLRALPIRAQLNGEILVPTLEEIAKRAKVSRSTVSRVVNQDPRVNVKTRERVSAVIKKSNYHPNLAARSLAAGRTRILGLVIPMGVTALFTDPYFPILIQGVTSACNARDHSVMLWLAEPEFERRTISQILHNGIVDGVILASMLVDDSLMQSLIESDMPFMLVGRHPTNNRVSYVDVDNINSARQVVEHLIEQGYHRIATIAGSKNMIAGADRLEGYLRALRDHNIPSNSNLIVVGDFSENGGFTAMNTLLAAKPDAVFVGSDTMALGALRAIRTAGLRVPTDIAIAGYDDMPFAENTDPPLTTIHQPTQRAGYIAAETLIELIANPGSEAKHIILPTELVVRASSLKA
ncbi:putative HTH-type transcriptional repressor ExuR [Anaerolineae bacterium]|nr:putative HTH-type transcriptional repressor ExuR [Anaerolineae bacterium]